MASPCPMSAIQISTPISERASTPLRSHRELNIESSSDSDEVICRDEVSQKSEEKHTLLAEVNHEDMLSKHRHDTELEISCKQKKTLGRTLAGYAKSVRSSMADIKDKNFLKSSSRFDRIKESEESKETDAIAQDMKDLFKRKRRIELGYISFCAVTMLIGLVAMTVHPFTGSLFMYVTWGVCILLDIAVVGSSVVYGHHELNRIELKYPQRNVKEEWACILKHELGHV